MSAPEGLPKATGGCVPERAYWDVSGDQTRSPHQGQTWALRQLLGGPWAKMLGLAATNQCSPWKGWNGAAPGRLSLPLSLSLLCRTDSGTRVAGGCRVTSEERMQTQ